MKKFVCLLLSLVLVCTCALALAATPVAATELEYKGEISLMHYSTSEESQGNGGSDALTAAPTLSARPSPAGRKRIRTSPSTRTSSPTPSTFPLFYAKMVVVAH